MKSLRVAVFASVMLIVPAVVSTVAFAQKALATDAQLTTDVERKIAGLKLGSSHVTVKVHDHIVALDGTVPTLWLKREVIDRARETKGIDRVDVTIDIAKAEGDAQLAAAVAKQLRNDSLYTVYDSVDGRVRDAVVTLTGWVLTANKRDEMTERLEKIPGVRDIKNGLTVLPFSPSDDQIRVTIASRLYSDPLFINYSQANPPIHVIVENGRVTLVGIVASQIERQKAEGVAGMVSGVVSVNDQVRLASEVRDP